MKIKAFLAALLLAGTAQAQTLVKLSTCGPTTPASRISRQTAWSVWKAA